MDKVCRLVPRIKVWKCNIPSEGMQRVGYPTIWWPTQRTLLEPFQVPQVLLGHTGLNYYQMQHLWHVKWKKGLLVAMDDSCADFAPDVSIWRCAFSLPPQSRGDFLVASSSWLEYYTRKSEERKRIYSPAQKPTSSFLITISDRPIFIPMQSKKNVPTNEANKSPWPGCMSTYVQSRKVCPFLVTSTNRGFRPVYFSFS